jgi:hypothetical protein
MSPTAGLDEAVKIEISFTAGNHNLSHDHPSLVVIELRRKVYRKVGEGIM